MPIVPPASELRSRLQQFREHMDRNKLSGALISDPVNVRYLSGFTGEDSALLVTRNRRVLLTDFRFVEEAGKTAKGWRVVTKPPTVMRKAGEQAKKLKLKVLGVEKHDLNLNEVSQLRKAAKGVRIKPMPTLLSKLRSIKSAWEVRQIEEALRIQEKSLRAVYRLLKPGLMEFEAAAELRYRMVMAGADDQAFESMFQWASNSSLPHGRPSRRKLKARGIVLIDWGAKYGGYHADLTRTFFLGTIPPRFRRIHEVVREAQAEAIERVGPGVPFKEVDKAARGVIRKAGFGRYFGHSTGHGLGMQVHEPPTLSSRAEGTLHPGMVVTVEPGIYLPGLGGVRIEDDVLVTPNGKRVLSAMPTGLRFDGTNE